MTIEPGSTVRTLLAVVTDDGAVIEPGARAHVVGYQGDRLVLDFHDQERDVHRSATVNVWEVRAERLARR